MSRKKKSQTNVSVKAYAGARSIECANCGSPPLIRNRNGRSESGASLVEKKAYSGAMIVILILNLGRDCYTHLHT